MRGLEKARIARKGGNRQESEVCYVRSLEKPKIAREQLLREPQAEEVLGKEVLGFVSRSVSVLERRTWSGLKRNSLKREVDENLESMHGERKARRRRGRWTCGRKDHVAAKCPIGCHAVNKRRDETTETFRDTSTPLSVPIPDTKGGVSVGAVQVKTHRNDVHLDASRTDRVLEIVKSSFSGGEEATNFQIPISVRSGLEAVFRQMEQPLSQDGVEEEML